MEEKRKREDLSEDLLHIHFISSQDEKVINPAKVFRFVELSLSFGQIKNIDELLKVIADSTIALLEADRTSIFVWDSRKKKLWTKVAHGIEDKIELEPDKGIVGWVFSKGENLIINDPYSDPRFNPDIDRKTGYRTKNILAVPLKTYSGNIVGVLEVINKKNGEFSEEDMKLAELLAIHAANSIENALLYEEIKRTQQEIVARLSIAAEFRDKTTYNHIMRMSFYSYEIAKEMGFGEEWCEKLRLASPMHDIGKLGVPDSILLKPGKLTEEEWVEMRKHTIYGYEILRDSDVDILKMAANIARCHHEKYDGSGYPDGLKGEEIPIEARIVAVADVFDALTSERPYKKAFPVEEAVEIIKKDTGKHFDPKVVSAFLKALPRILKIKEKFPD